MKRHVFASGVLAAVTSVMAFSASAAQGAHAEHQHTMHAQHQHDHMQHEHAAPETTPLTRSVATYRVPDVVLVRDDGKKVRLVQVMEDTRPMFLNFIYTSCTAVCPVMSQVFAGLQNRMGSGSGKVGMVSISIDPEYDTPARLSEYARRYKAGQQWRFYTGTIETSMAVQKAFNVYNVDKMNHKVVTFFRAKPDSAWVRLDGFVMPEQLLQEYSNSSKSRGS